MPCSAQNGITSCRSLARAGGRAPGCMRRGRDPRSQDLAEFVDREVRDAPGEDLSLLEQVLERRHRLLDRVVAGPMEQIEIEAVGAQPREAVLAGLTVPRRDAFSGSTFEARKTSSRRPAIASPTSSSTTPEPYISAVSSGSCPRSSPRRSAAIAAARSCSISQVPCPDHGDRAEPSRPKWPRSRIAPGWRSRM